MKSVDLTFVTATVALRHYSDIVALAKPTERRGEQMSWIFFN